jgi:hypothetical protein
MHVKQGQQWALVFMLLWMKPKEVLEDSCYSVWSSSYVYVRSHYISILQFYSWNFQLDFVQCSHIKFAELECPFAHISMFSET